MRTLYILIMSLFLCVTSYAQNLDSLKTVSEELKRNYGINDARYLNSLSEVVKAAINEEDYRTAYDYRKRYYNIVKEKHGEKSPEYADACLRMGTVSYYYIGANEAIKFYLDALTLFDELNIFNDTYLQGVSLLCKMYLETGDYDTYLSIHKELISMLERAGEDYAIFLLNEYVGSYSYLMQFEDYDTVLDYMYKAQKLIKKHDLGFLLTEQASIAFAVPRICYRTMGKFDKAVEAGKSAQQYIKNVYGEDSIPYAQYDILIALDLIAQGELEKSRPYVMHGFSLIEEVSKRDGLTAHDEPTYLPAAILLARFSERDNDQKGAISYRELADKIFRLQNDTESEDFYDNLYNLYLDYGTCGEYMKLISVFPAIEEWVASTYGSGSDELFQVLITAHDGYVYTYNKSDALKVDEKIQTFTNKPASLGLFMKASVHSQFNEYDQAQDLLKQCLDEILDNPTEDEKRLIPLCYNSLGYVVMEYDLEGAVGYLQKAIEYNNKYLTGKQGANIDPLVNLGMVHYKSGAYLEAVKYFNEALSHSQQTQNIYKAALCLNNIGLCYLYSGNQVKGIRVLEDALKLAEEHSGKLSHLYATTLQNMTIYYGNLQEQDRCIAITKEIANIYETLLGKDSANYGGAIYNIGVFNMLKANYGESIIYCNEAKTILENAQGDNRLMLSNLYSTLGFCHYMSGNKDEGAAEFAKSATLLEELGLGKSIDAVSLLYNYGYVLLANLDKKAESFIKDAVIIAEEIDMLHHPVAFSAMSVYGLASLLNEGPAEGYIDLVVNTLHEQYSTNFGEFNEEEREQFWSRFVLLDDILFTCRTNDVANGSLYDYTLATKGMLLSTSLNMEEIIRRSGSKELIDNYSVLQNLRSRIERLEQTPYNERIESVDSLKNVAAVIERKVIAGSKEYGEFTSRIRVSWKDIESALKKNDVAIEFVNYMDYKANEAVYAALVIRKGWDAPELVKIASAKELNDVISENDALSYAVRINNIYSNSDTYGLVWKPLEQFVTPGDNVYFSASGILHNLSIEYLVDDNEIYASDKYNLYRVSSTRDIAISSRDKLPIKQYKRASLYGGILYDLDMDVMMQESQKYDTNITRSIELEEGDTLRSSLTYLRGSEIEVKSVSDILTKNGVQSSIHKGKEANEESFKSLSEQHNDIIHIATHGFYLPTEKAEENDFLKLMPMFIPGSDAQSKSNPIKTSMLRSGLVFAGGNRAWKGEKVTKDIDDGIATSAEIANISLAGTDLVVLSACETGLGEVNDEGVFGLQRAFKKAGANTIIMSLWKVNDHITQMMMTSFYEHLLSGKSKRDSFRLAQQEIRAEYPNPYQWAAFIMLD